MVLETDGSGARYGVCDDERSTIMNGYGFSAYSYGPFERCLSDPGGSDGNTIFVRDSAAVETRLRGAP